MTLNRPSAIKPYEAAYGESIGQTPLQEQDNAETHNVNLREPVQSASGNGNAVLENGCVVRSSNIENKTREDTGQGMHIVLRSPTLYLDFGISCMQHARGMILKYLAIYEISAIVSDSSHSSIYSAI